MTTLVQKIIEHQDNISCLEKMLTEMDAHRRSSLQVIIDLSLPEMLCHPKVSTIL